MKVIQAQDENDYIQITNTWLKEKSKPGDLIHLPAGNTPIPIYKNWETHKFEFLNQLYFQQVDEVITGTHQGLFANFFKAQLPSYQNRFFPLEDEPRLSNCALLGIGENGHIAFHEPEIPNNFNYGCVPLSETTRNSLSLSKDSFGLSYGLGTFLKVPHILLLASGIKKVPIVKSLLNSKSEEYVVSHLKKHSDLTLILHSNMISI